MNKYTPCFAALLVASSLLTACNSDAKTPSNHSSQAASINLTPPKDNDGDVVKALQTNLDKSGVHIHVQSAVPTQMDGIYWASFNNAPAMFTDRTGSHLIQGQIIALGGDRPVDISAQIKAQTAKQQLEQVPLDEMIIIPAQGKTQAVLYVFTDPTCHYCQKLHSEIDQTTKAGVEVRYLAWPRTQSALPLANSIWCSDDRATALTDAKKGKRPSSKQCDNSPVAKHIALGEQLGVSGTPAVFTASGLQIGGYLPSAELVKLALENQ